MKNFGLIAIMFAVTFTASSQALGYEDLALIFSQEDTNGTARFTAMSGAFGAVGGDISSLNINPAGLAVYNTSAFAGTLSSRTSNTEAKYYGNSVSTQEQFFDVSHAGAVLVFDNSYESDWNKFALGVNYRITKDFTDSFNAKGNSGLATFTSFPYDNNDPVLEYNIADEQRFNNIYSGELSEINIAFSAVHQDKLYVGMGLNLYDLNFAQNATLLEFNSDTNGNELDADFYQEIITVGGGASLNAGFIYKLNNSMRFGLAYQTPTWFAEIIEENNILDNDGYFGDTRIVVSEDSRVYDNTSGDYFPMQSFIYRLKTPSKLTASTAFIFGKNGLISFDYTNKNYRNIRLSNGDFSFENQQFQDNLRNTHSYNIGTEWRLERFSIRGGYKFEQSPDKNAKKSDDLVGYSFGGGYDFGNTKVDLSFSNNNRTGLYNFYSGYNVDPAELKFDNKIITATLTFNL